MMFCRSRPPQRCAKPGHRDCFGGVMAMNDALFALLRLLLNVIACSSACRKMWITRRAEMETKRRLGAVWNLARNPASCGIKPVISGLVTRLVLHRLSYSRR